MSIENAAHLLLSRIAFSNNIKEIRIIIESFVSAYVSANPSTQMNKLHLLRTVAVYILLSATIGQPIEMTLEKFSKYMEKVRLVHATSIKEIYQSMKEAPIAIFLPFVINTSEKPILTKTSLVKKKADFALKKKRFIEVSNKKFRCYNDQTKKVLNVEFSLKNVHDELPNEGKDFNKIILTTYTEEPLYVKSKKKEFDYSFTVDDDREVLLWREAINYNSFLATLTSYIKQLKAAN
ncbi:hypothetical protein GPJ56_003108 [Histomonas meleagridis]|uniref:uncharacterized protein n=1 Tax=Histomonas meleagridis TaxID=135588 RepID=UPI003559A73D|nr:hypothetical protein GPJ56_003108 [Histomonas meleagridis]KAH0796115.1 hypothetical protein GO595_011082 [Histomonas meleagridis]